MIRYQISPAVEKQLDFLEAAGHGWAKFAGNVRQQNWVSDSQQRTLLDMERKLKRQRRRVRQAQRRAQRQHDADMASETDISDSEAMDLGTFF